ncbi:CTP:molybdopterin cytidylyltransferase MocA [Humidesulfovibrio mexicanus]|uniref:CTP:molybdopterin cytidylyltransferase MocA n=1 Tax=Humidesulfovibrio mexicanus TaxID=147047 RepID=A0A239BSP9_9BACT|nr:NTP transferase domain-containing protein [Humidesulfovibrio mexicanus]SNS10183.1 CTP:molybdopterin cytidylyltransferase MocA [Humidesulfovibrio mexicanus]
MSPHARPHPVRAAALILAAGLSSRLGAFKPLEKIGGLSLLARVADLFRQAGVADVLAVAGHCAEETLAEAARLGIRGVANPDYERGMFTSVAAGLRHLTSAAAMPPDALFVLPVDIPLVRPHTLRLLLDRFAASASASSPAVLHPFFAGLRGHPPLIRAAHLPDILAWTGPGGLRGALERLEASHGAEDVPVADGCIHFDIDTPADLDTARLLLARRDIPTPVEAEALLRLYDTCGRGLGHGRGVADAALAMAGALAATGVALDLELVESAALVHDIAKGRPRHEAAGAALLDSLGFGRVARIVEVHRDIAPDAAPRIAERELVYLADKLVRGATPVSISARFQEKLDRYAQDPEACAAIRRRLGNALDMARRIEAAAGAPLHRIVPGVPEQP